MFSGIGSNPTGFYSSAHFRSRSAASCSSCYYTVIRFHSQTLIMKVQLFASAAIVLLNALPGALSAEVSLIITSSMHCRDLSCLAYTYPILILNLSLSRHTQHLCSHNSVASSLLPTPRMNSSSWRSLMKKLWSMCLRRISLPRIMLVTVFVMLMPVSIRRFLMLITVSRRGLTVLPRGTMVLPRRELIASLGNRPMFRIKLAASIRGLIVSIRRFLILMAVSRIKLTVSTRGLPVPRVELLLATLGNRPVPLLAIRKRSHMPLLKWCPTKTSVVPFGSMANVLIHLFLGKGEMNDVIKLQSMRHKLHYDIQH